MTKKWNSRRVEDIEKDPKKMAGKWQLYLSLIKIKIIIEMSIKKNCSKKNHYVWDLNWVNSLYIHKKEKK